MSNRIINQISLKANEELIKRTKQRSPRYFHMVGREQLVNIAPEGAKTKEWRMQGIDFIDAFVAMSSKEQKVVKLIKDCIKWDPELNSLNYIVELAPDSVHFNPDVEGTMSYRMFLDGYSLLFKKDLVRRVSRNRYMFNPEFFVITGEAQLYFDQKWNESTSAKADVF